jgi:hypothetical protein
MANSIKKIFLKNLKEKTHLKVGVKMGVSTSTI